jgi:hypothetical protein
MKRGITNLNQGVESLLPWTLGPLQQQRDECEDKGKGNDRITGTAGAPELERVRFVEYFRVDHRKCKLNKVNNVGHDQHREFAGTVTADKLGAEEDDEEDEVNSNLKAAVLSVAFAVYLKVDLAIRATVLPTRAIRSVITIDRVWKTSRLNPNDSEPKEGTVFRLGSQ